MTISLSADQTSIVDGQTVNFTVKVTPVANAAVPTGRVTLIDAAGGQHGSALLSNGTATFPATNLTDGSWQIHAVYAGSATFDSADSSTQSPPAVVQMQVASSLPPATAVALTASATHITAGDNVTFYATVSNTQTSTIPQGTITLNNTAGCITPGCPQANLDASGKATLEIDNWTAGVYVITANFKGNQFQPSQAQITITVDPNTTSLIDTTTTVLANNGVYSVPSSATFPLVATVTQAKLTTPASGDNVAFFKVLNGTSQRDYIGSAPLRWNGTIGTASLDAGPWSPGKYTVEADFIGFDSLGASSGQTAVGVYDPSVGTPIPTKIAYTGDTAGISGSAENIAFVLTDGSGNVLPSELVYVSIDGGAPVALTTAADGSVALPATLATGTHTVSASFGGDGLLQSSTGSGTVVVSKLPTALAYSGDTAVHAGAPANVRFVLTDTTNGTTLAGKSVAITINGQTTTVTTDGGGVATLSVTLPVGTYAATAHFDGTNDPVYLSSDGSGQLVVTPKPVTTIVDNTTGNFLLGSTATLSGTLLSNGVPVAGETLTLSFGGVSCTAGPTAANGTATCTVIVPGPTGPTTTKASFAGDAAYAAPAAPDTKPALVYAFGVGSGNFVVGDKTATGSVYFWGSQWWKVNQLSAGDAQAVDPSAFKGFAASPTIPQCGGTWSTLPGNSTPPPGAPLPAYMAIIVTSQNHKAPGKIITGNILHIVIVKTDPGYAGNPGHDGKGTVVATVC